MNKNIFSLLATTLCIMPAMAQQIDFNIASRRPAEVTENGFLPYAYPGKADINGISLAVLPDNGLRTNWWKQGIQQGACLTSDGVCNGQGQISIRIEGLEKGHHSLLAYHNIIDDISGNIPEISVAVNGKTVLKGVKSTVRATKTSDAAYSYIDFNVNDGNPVIVTYTYMPSKKQDFAASSITINGIILDRPDPKNMAVNPYPANDNMYADADNGSLTLNWTGAHNATSQKLYFGKDPKHLNLIATLKQQTYCLKELSSADTYYWRVDEVSSEGKTTLGTMWAFRTRRLAFPGAEGYGRFAIGGRGGSVYHVTSLDDDPANPQPGSLRYGITKINGPRTIVFDISGIIYVKDRMVCSDSYITVAGQTAPGKGILLTEHPFGFGSDGIFRFLRLRLGKHLDKNGKTITLDGMGAAGCNNTIIDHCSVGWTIDEAFSSRNGRNISFQHNLISEALNKAGHQNYVGAQHGYAATIGGNVGSFHHNLLAHNEGRNWSMGGGLDGAGYYAGRLDLFNNVVYNWGNRACDGGAHEVNFVNNYYKMGPATTMKYILNAQLEGTGRGSQSYYVKGNIRQNCNGTKIGDKEGETYEYTTKNNQVVDWQVFTDKPFFPSYAKIETADAAFKNVLSDVGATLPAEDEHDKRMIQETLNGTYKYTGSGTGKKGLIDDNKDAGNDAITEFEGTSEQRNADWDKDGDGMPDWWEMLAGTDYKNADNNMMTADTGEGKATIDGVSEYTNLEMYINWIAVPNFHISDSQKLSININDYFAGYGNNSKYTVITPEGIKAKTTSKGKVILTFTEKAKHGLFHITVTATDKDNTASLSRSFNIAKD